jgi:hypothetical protein
MDLPKLEQLQAVAQFLQHLGLLVIIQFHPTAQFRQLVDHRATTQPFQLMEVQLLLSVARLVQLLVQVLLGFLVIVRSHLTFQFQPPVELQAMEQHLPLIAAQVRLSLAQLRQVMVQSQEAVQHLLMARFRLQEI